MAKRLMDTKSTPIVFNNGGAREDFSFSNGAQYNLLTNSTAKAFHDCMLAAYNEQRPMIIYDYNDDKCIYLTSAGTNGYNDKLGSQMAYATFVIIDSAAVAYYMFDTSADAEGNIIMDLTVTNEYIGNIPLYRHNLVINGTINKEYISSKDLAVDSIQDLTTLINAVNGTTIVIDKDTTMVYSGGVWKIGNTNVTSVNDTVYRV